MGTRRHVVLLALLAAVPLLLLAACGGVTADNEVLASDHEEEAGHQDGEAGHEDKEAETGHAHAADVEEHEEDHAHAQTTHDAIDGAKEIRVVAKEWGFEPASVHMHEGEAVNIVLVNEGVLEHEIELDAFDFHVHAEAGETVTAGFVPEETGDFEFACFVPGHYDAGMVGEVVVEHAH